MVSRRMVLISGGAAALVAVAGTAGYVTYPSLAAARAPWSQAGESFGDPRLDALAYAILAPNPHNMQPWQFALRGADGIDVTCDLSRRLEHTDPPDRQITIGFGCMLELLRMAAAEAGYRAEIVPFPDGEPYPRLDERRVAEVTFVRDPTVARDPLFTDVLDRRSTKVPFDRERPVPPDALAAMGRVVDPRLEAGGTVDPERVAALIDMTTRGWMIEYENGPTRRESIDVMRIGNRAVVENPDGIDMGGTSMGLMNLTGLVTKDQLDTPGSIAYQSGIDMYVDMIDSAQGFVWMIAPQRDRAHEIAAGQSWVRMNLAANRAGIAFHPLSQILQEFPEMRALYDAIHRDLNATGTSVVHMLSRIGYAPDQPASPRWPLEAKIVSVESV